MLLRFLFGEDVFISYTRADAITYAAGLAGELTRRDFSCFLDQWGTPPGRELPEPLQRALRRSGCLVLVGSEGALRSAAVEKEVLIFRRTGRMIIPIDFGGTLVRAPWYDAIAGLALTPESPDALLSGNPSPTVLNRIEKSFQYTRRNQRARRVYTTSAILLLLLAVVSGYFSREATRSAVHAREQEALARSSANEASIQAAQARKNAEEAGAKAVEAQRQQKLAEARQRLARSRELASNATSLLETDPELSVALAAEAVRTDVNLQTEVALRRALAESRVRAVIQDATDGIFSPDSTRFASVQKGNRIRITQVQTGEWFDLQSGGQYLQRPQFSPDGSRVAAVCNQNSVCVFDLATRQAAVRIEAHQRPMRSIRFSPDGRMLATTSEDRTARVFDADTGRERAALRDLPNIPFDSLFSPDGTSVLTTLEWQEAKVWDSRTGRVVKSWPEGPILANVPWMWTPDGSHILALTNTGPPQLWRVSDWQPAVTLNAKGVRMASFSRDGKYLLLDSYGEVLGFEMPTGRRYVNFGGLGFDAARLHPDSGGQTIITANTPGVAKVWRYSTALATLRGHRADIADAWFSNDGAWALTTAKDRTVRLWDPDTRGADVTVPGDGRQLTAYASFSPDGTLAATTGRASTRLWNTTTGRILHVLPGRSTSRPAFSADNQLVTTEDERYIVHIWDTRTGQPLAKLKGHSNGVAKVAFSPDSSVVATQSSGESWVWDTRTGRLRFRSGARTEVTDLAFTTDGRLFVTAHKEWARAPLRFWDVRSGRLAFTLSGGRRGVQLMRFSPRGELVVTIDDESTMQVWSVPGRAKVAERHVPGGTLQGLVFSGDGRSVITWSEEKNRTEVRAWDASTWNSVVAGVLEGSILSSNGKFARTSDRLVEISTGLTLLTLRGHKGRVAEDVLSADGQRVLTVEEDGTARVYVCELCLAAAPLAELADKRLRLTGRVLNSDERRRYLPDSPVENPPPLQRGQRR